MMTAEHSANPTSGPMAGASAPASSLGDGMRAAAASSSPLSSATTDIHGSSPTAYDDAVMAPQARARSAEEKPKARTTGWKIFDFVVYGLINFGGNVATSFWVANSMYDHHHTGKEYTGLQKILIPFDKFGQFLESKIFKPGFDIALKESHSKALTGLFGSVLALSWGGTLLLAPVKFIEDNKPKIVRKLDAMMDGLRGHKLTEQEQKDRDATYQLLDSHDTKKTWAQAISARIYSVAVGVLGGLGLTMLVDPKAKGFLRIADFWNNKVSPLIREKAPNSKLLNSLAPVAHPEMAAIEKVGKDAYITKLTRTMGKENAVKHVQDVYAANKPAWNVSNMTVELVGSGITAGMFYVKLMFQELFGKADAKKDAATETNMAETPAPLKPRQMANGLIIANPEAKDKAHDRMAHDSMAQATDHAASEADKQFAANLTKRDAQSTIRELADHGSKHSAAHGGHAQQHSTHAQHADGVQHSRAHADTEHGRG